MVGRLLYASALLLLGACDPAPWDALDDTGWNTYPPGSIQHAVTITFADGRYEETRTHIKNFGWALVERERGGYVLDGGQLSFLPTETTCPPLGPTRTGPVEFQENGLLRIVSEREGLLIFNPWDGRMVYSPPVVRTDEGCLPPADE